MQEFIIVKGRQMQERTKFSIVTVCRNAAVTIEKTIQSVISQTYKNIEYIVVDGLSADGTLSVVQAYRQHIDVLMSEKDQGIYDAMNKGIRAATGDIISFLNADDRLFSERSIESVAAFISRHEPGSIDVYHGSVVFFNYQKGNGFVWKSGPISNLFIHREAQPHAATFYTRAAFEKNGLFDTSYRISGDREWTVRAFKKNRLAFQYMPLLVSVIAKGGISTTPANASLQYAESRRALTSHFTRTEDIYLRILKRLRRKWIRLGRPLFQ
jgi:glycosyltransferase involved in cell wall biosynthesis